MATWPPGDVPQAVDQPFPEEWGQAAPQPFEVIDGTQPIQAEAVPPWEVQFPGQALEQATEAPLAADPTGTLGYVAPAQDWPPSRGEALQVTANENADPAWNPGRTLEQAGQRNAAERAADPEAYATMEQYKLKASAEKQQAEGDLRLAQDYKAQLAKSQEQDAREGQIAALTEASVREAWDEAKNMKVDPNAMWGSMSVAGKVTSVIGAAIGGFLSARQQTGRNQFMETYNQRVAESIHAQEANMANMRANAAGQQSMYGMMLDRFKDAKTARHMAAAAMYEAGSRELAAEVSKFKSPMTQEEGQLALVQLGKARDGALGAARQQQFENTLALDEQARKDADTQSQMAERDRKAAAAAAAGRVKPGANALGQMTDVNGDGKVNKLDLTEKQREQAIFNEYGEPITDPETGTLIVAGNAAQAGSIGKGLAKAKQARANLAEYHRLRQSYGRETGGEKGYTEGARKMRSARSLAMKSVKDAWELGAITESDFTLISGAIPDIPGATDLNVDHEALPRVIEDLDFGVDAQMNALGYSGSYSKNMHGRVQAKPGAVAEEAQTPTGKVVDVRTPAQKAKEKAAEDKIAANEAEKAKRAAAEEKGQADFEAIGTENLTGSLLVVSKGKTIRVPNNDASRKALKAGKYKLATPEQQEAYKPPSMVDD